MSMVMGMKYKPPLEVLMKSITFLAKPIFQAIVGAKFFGTYMIR